jgi:hypothetical protein
MSGCLPGERRIDAGNTPMTWTIPSGSVGPLLSRIIDPTAEALAPNDLRQKASDMTTTLAPARKSSAPKKRPTRGVARRTLHKFALLVAIPTSNERPSIVAMAPSSPYSARSSHTGLD